MKKKREKEDVKFSLYGNIIVNSIQGRETVDLSMVVIE